MTEDRQRVEELKSAIADLRVEEPSSRIERRWLSLGVACMVVALAISVLAYLQSGREGELEQNELLSLGVAAIVLTLIGVALFLRYSIGRLLRFWLVRVVAEMRTVTDQTGRDRPSGAA